MWVCPFCSFHVSVSVLFISCECVRSVHYYRTRRLSFILADNDGHYYTTVGDCCLKWCSQWWYTTILQYCKRVGIAGPTTTTATHHPLGWYMDNYVCLWYSCVSVLQPFPQWRWVPHRWVQSGDTIWMLNVKFVSNSYFGSTLVHTNSLSASERNLCWHKYSRSSPHNNEHTHWNEQNGHTHMKWTERTHSHEINRKLHCNTAHKYILTRVLNQLVY